jgi:hypothetical protein
MDGPCLPWGRALRATSSCLSSARARTALLPSLGVGDTDRACSPLVSSLSKVPAPSSLGKLGCSPGWPSWSLAVQRSFSLVPTLICRLAVVGASSMTDTSPTELLRPWLGAIEKEENLT